MLLQTKAVKIKPLAMLAYKSSLWQEGQGL